MIELLSIDLSNYCTKECPFCYNHSNKDGNIVWWPNEVISFAMDCIAHGVKAVSLGGGEPLEYEGIFEIIDALSPHCYVSITTNGLPLLNSQIKKDLAIHKPDKIHLTLHNPDDEREFQRIFEQLDEIQFMDIKPGINLLISNDKLTHAKRAYQILRTKLSSDQLILIPQRFSKTPTPRDIAFVTGGEKFQSPSCLLGCNPPQNFVSVSWDKKVNFCSYAGGKAPLEELSYNGVLKALKKVYFSSCSK